MVAAKEKANGYDEVKVARMFISGSMTLEDIKSVFGITKTQVKSAVRNNANEAVNKLVTEAYEALEITDPYVFNRKPQDRPSNWNSKYTPSALSKKGTKIGKAMTILEAHIEKGTLTRDNRGAVVKEIMKDLKLKNEMTAKTYFADAKKLLKADYSD